MEHLIRAFKRTDAEKRIPVLRLELDYELLTLHDALLAEDLNQIEQCKRRLSEMRKEMMLLEGFTNHTFYNEQRIVR